MTSALVLALVERERGRAGVDALLREAGLAGEEARLRDERQWLTWTEKVRLLEASASVLGDPRPGFRLGAVAVTAEGGAGVRLAARMLGNPGPLLAHADRFAAKFASSHRFDVLEAGDAGAVLRHRDVTGVGYHRHDCDYNVGLLRAVPELFGLPTARVEHRECGVDGAPGCVYRVRWQRRGGGRRLAAWVGASSALGAGLAAFAGPELAPLTAAGLGGAAALAARHGVAAQRARLRRLRDQLDEQRRTGERWAQSLRTLTAAQGVDGVIDLIGREGRGVIGGRDHALLLTDDEGVLTHHSDEGLGADDARRFERWARSRAFAAGEAVIVEDAAADPGLRELAHGSVVAAPLDHQGRTLGLLAVFAPGAAAFGGYDAQLLYDYAAQAGVALANATLLERLQSVATRDPLTGLLNEAGFADAVNRELAHAAGAPRAVAVLVAGDAADEPRVRAAAAALRTAVQDRPGAELARLSSSEFAVLLGEAASPAAHTVVDALRTAAGDAAGLELAAGYAVSPRHGEGAATLVRRARTAVHGAGTRRYDPLEDASAALAEERREVEAMLAAPERIVPHFQPIVDLATGAIRGYEALTRFTDEQRRPPDVWFAMAHRTGYGPQLEALAAARALRVGGRPEGTLLSLNASPTTLASPELWAVLPQDLTGLTIEVTEQEAAGAGDELERALTEVRERGGRVALDDAGSGWAGLQQLIRVAPDVIKLDRALVAGIDEAPATRSLVHALVTFARSTGATVCAEGVEHEGERTALQAIGSTTAQGWLFGRPQPDWQTFVADVSARSRPAAAPSAHPASRPAGAAAGART